jgi:hypothetical protein
MNTKKEFMEPGKDNKEDRMNFVEFWAKYIQTHSDEEWSRQQNRLINSQLQISRELQRNRIN